MKKIAYLTNQYPKVSHTFIRREIQALEDEGLEVERYSVRRTTDALADPADRDEAERTKVVLDGGVTGLAAGLARNALQRPACFAKAAARAVRMGVRSERGIARHVAYLAEACVLRDWMKRASVDHVHVHFGTNSTTVALLCKELGGPSYSFTVHGPEEFDKPELIRLSEKIEEAEFVAGVSSFGRSQLYRRVDAEHWPKVHVVRCGVDASFLDGNGVAFPSAPRLVCVGRLCEQKGQLLLIEAAGRLKEAGLDFELILVGDGEMRRDVEKRIAEYGLERNVTITGWMSGQDVREELLKARAMVLPSFAEGLPVVIMEALGLGRPVISTYVAGIPELVENGKCGWLVPAGSVDALEDAMRQVLEASPADLARLGEEGRRRVAEFHDVRKNARTLHELMT